MTMVDIQYASTGNSLTGLVLAGIITASAVTTTGDSPPQIPPAAMLSEQFREWERTPTFAQPEESHGITAEQLRRALTQFAGRMLDNTIDPVPEFDAIISEHFWDLA
jgi:hypothetical protein